MYHKPAFKKYVKIHHRCQEYHGGSPNENENSQQMKKRLGYLQVVPQTTFPQLRMTGSSKSRPQPGMSHKKSSTRHSTTDPTAVSGSSSDASAASLLFPGGACACDKPVHQLASTYMCNLPECNSRVLRPHRTIPYMSVVHTVRALTL